MGLFVTSLFFIVRAATATRPVRITSWSAAGAFPEIHMPQFPLEMGRKDAGSNNKTLAVTLGNDGNIKYDAILHQGRNKDKIIASEHSALVPKIDKEVCGRCPGL